MSAADSGWRANAPLDGEVPPRPAARTRPPRGQVHVLVHELARGGSEVRVGSKVFSDIELIDAAIAELQAARRLLQGLAAEGGRAENE